MSYKIITDSSSGLTNDIIKCFDLTVIPLSLIVEGDVMEIQTSEAFLKDFYDNLRAKKSMSTSCINPDTFYKEFKKELDLGNDVIYIGLSSGLSSTVSNAVATAEKLKKEYPLRQIYVVDSMNASMGEGLLVYTACIKKEEGLKIDELYKFLTSNRMNLNSLFTVKTLWFLARGGRISKLSMTVGSVVDIKPVMYVNEKGKLVSSSKVIGRRRSIYAIADNFVKATKDNAPQTVFIGHGDCIEDAELLAKTISEKMPVKSFVFNYIDPIIAVHSGPETLAVFGFGVTREVAESEPIKIYDFKSVKI